MANTSNAAAKGQGNGGASKVAADTIREMILSGELDPGQRLPPERELAQTFGFSRSSVREAVSQLSALGILTARQGDGTYVSSLDSEELFAPLDFALRVDKRSMLHLTELRLILEPHVAAVAAARLSPEAERMLASALDGYRQQVESGDPDPDALIQHDETIHDTLIETAGNPLLAAIIGSVGSALRRGRELTVVMPSAPSESLTELQAVVDAVLSHDPPRASATMTWHVSRWAERIRVAVEEAEEVADAAAAARADDEAGEG